jgi:hypothetical protein
MAKHGKNGKQHEHPDHIDCPREDDDPHMRGEGWGNVPDDRRGEGSHETVKDEEGY